MEISVLRDEPAMGAATIVLNRPRGNALTGSMVKALKEALSELDADKRVHVVVLRASEESRYFCTGMDLGATSEMKGALTSGDDVFSALAAFSKPLVGRIHGPCLGGGIGLFFCCDIRVVSSAFYMSFAEVRRGLVPALISAVITPQLGLFRTRQYMLTAERVSAAALWRDGLVSDVVSHGDEKALDEVILSRVKMLLAGAPGAQQEVKRLTAKVAHDGPNQSAAYVRDAFQRMMTSQEASHGLAAFHGKEDPKWVAYTRSKL